eukprot:gnl/Chilomastix_cuspidata/1725.p1 GENE.gnl/Chilomastix_cuspidata/1725~~gnl/Chilomastix_cuspidata/1725.p1  ORF type:complete len:1037 (+),score=482.13 gnl/Chilomastix_cuspidata/1725:3-3113(+)
MPRAPPAVDGDAPVFFGGLRAVRLSAFEAGLLLVKANGEVFFHGLDEDFEKSSTFSETTKQIHFESQQLTAAQIKSTRSTESLGNATPNEFVASMEGSRIPITPENGFVRVAKFPFPEVRPNEYLMPRRILLAPDGSALLVLTREFLGVFLFVRDQPEFWRCVFSDHAFAYLDVAFTPDSRGLVAIPAVAPGTVVLLSLHLGPRAHDGEARAAATEPSALCRAPRQSAPLQSFEKLQVLRRMSFPKDALAADVASGTLFSARGLPASTPSLQRDRKPVPRKPHVRHLRGVPAAPVTVVGLGGAWDRAGMLTKIRTCASVHANQVFAVMWGEHVSGPISLLRLLERRPQPGAPACGARYEWKATHLTLNNLWQPKPTERALTGCGARPLPGSGNTAFPRIRVVDCALSEPFGEYLGVLFAKTHFVPFAPDTARARAAPEMIPEQPIPTCYGDGLFFLQAPTRDLVRRRGPVSPLIEFRPVCARPHFFVREGLTYDTLSPKGIAILEGDRLRADESFIGAAGKLPPAPSARRACAHIDINKKTKRPTALPMALLPASELFWPSGVVSMSARDATERALSFETRVWKLSDSAALTQLAPCQEYLFLKFERDAPMGVSGPVMRTGHRPAGAFQFSFRVDAAHFPVLYEAVPGTELFFASIQTQIDTRARAKKAGAKKKKKRRGGDMAQRRRYVTKLCNDMLYSTMFGNFCRFWCGLRHVTRLLTNVRAVSNNLLQISMEKQVAAPLCDATPFPLARWCDRFNTCSNSFLNKFCRGSLLKFLSKDKVSLVDVLGLCPTPGDGAALDQPQVISKNLIPGCLSPAELLAVQAARAPAPGDAATQQWDQHPLFHPVDGDAHVSARSVFLLTDGWIKLNFQLPTNHWLVVLRNIIHSLGTTALYVPESLWISVCSSANATTNWMVKAAGRPAIEPIKELVRITSARHGGAQLTDNPLIFVLPTIMNATFWRLPRRRHGGQDDCEAPQHALFAAKHRHRCSQCLRPLDIKQICGRCLSTFYCSVECQTMAWARHHRAECAERRRDK